MSGDLLQLASALWPHVAAVALCAARLFPVAFLCPLFGGATAPATVRLGLVLGLSLALHLSAGVAPVSPVEDAWVFAGLAGRELALGTAMGLIASLPFDAARIGGRLIDLVRGTSAEAALPVAGTRESATGDGLYQMLVALAVTGVAFPLVLGALWKSFAAVKLGAYVPTEVAAMHVVRLGGAALAAGLAVGAPIAGAVMAADALVAMASKVAAPMNLAEVGAPLRILGGGAVVWLGLGVICDRLLSEVAGSSTALEVLFEVAR
ncbi:MAG: flagellar biosynthetic protein FliR [Myxococcales bacterium]|nr:flagellar biosynthetic protein FliR [Myxococcales bacterium]